MNILSNRDYENLIKFSNLEKYTHDYINENADKFGVSTWNYLAHHNELPPEMIDKYGDKFDGATWNYLAYNNKLTPGMIDKYGDKFDGDTWYYLAKNNKFTPEMIDKYGDKFGVSTWDYLAKNNKFTPEMIDKYGDKFGVSTWDYLAYNHELTPEMIDKYGDKFDRVTWDYLAYNHELTPEMIDKYGDKFGRTIWNYLAKNNKLTPEMIQKYVDKFDGATWYYLAYNNKLTPEMIDKYYTEFPEAKVLRKYLSQDFLIKNQEVPEGFDKNEYVVKVHRNQYIFRTLEKFMEDNNLEVINIADANKSKNPIWEKLKNQPLVKNLIYENNGKPITKKNIEEAQLKLQKQEYYLLHGEYSQAQSDTNFEDLSRKTIALGLKDLETDSETKRFIETEGPKLKHSTHDIGFGNRNLGWILYKDISGQVGYPAYLIEQIQSDWRGLVPKLRNAVDGAEENKEQYKQLLQDWEDNYGGIDGVNRIQNKLDELVKDYPEMLINAFLERVKGKAIFMTGKDKITELIDYDDSKKATMPEIIYDRLPRSLGFIESQEFPGYLKLEKAKLKLSKRD